MLHQLLWEGNNGKKENTYWNGKHSRLLRKIRKDRKRADQNRQLPSNKSTRTLGVKHGPHRRLPMQYGRKGLQDSREKQLDVANKAMQVSV